MITDRKLRIIKTKIIWMRGYPAPDGPYIRWWERQDPFAMEKQARQLSIGQASRLIGSAARGEWQAVVELTASMEMLKRLKDFWDYTTGEDRKILAQSMFDEIVYDLDTKRIVDFKLKSQAEPFLVLRAALYEDEMGEEMKNRFNSGLSSRG